ncbi:MAG: DUF2273 domain-containing protein [Clostridia bacterium]|nr:DUF2273 domain-containing protein [Clostridia bacterium]
MNKTEERVRELFTIGTPQCAVICGMIGALLALSFIFLGIWKTLFIILLGLIGVYAGGVKDKGEGIKKIVNRLFPPKGK